MGKHWTWTELIIELSKLDNCCLDCQHFIIRDLHDWITKQSEYMDWLIEEGKNPKETPTAAQKKKHLIQAYEAAQDPENIRPVGDMPQNEFSIYPIDK